MTIDPYYQKEDVPNDSTFWQYKVYADARGGSRDLCKFSLDLRMPAPIYTDMACRARCQNHVAFVDDSCQSTELFLELTHYVVSGHFK